VPEGLRLDPDLRWQLLTALVATGAADAGDVAAERVQDDTATGRTAEVRALASRPDAAVRADAWDSAWNDLSLSNDHLDATIAGIRAGGRRDLIADFDAEYFARIAGVWGERSIELAQRLVVGLFPASDSLEPVDAWLAAHPDAPAALRRIVVEQRDHLARDLRVRAMHPVPGH
ncbi:MAG: ERAP1-like C-terminal domain-containing protein, partial [Microbacterium sp.]